jgi:hypothetical protein
MEREDAALFGSLFDPTVSAAQIERYRQELIRPGVTRRVLRERERVPLGESPADSAYRVSLELFEETGRQARLVSAGLTVRGPADANHDMWRIASADALTAVQGLYRLRVDTTRSFAARDFEIAGPDLLLRLKKGTVFTIDCDDGVTGLVLLGQGEMRFAPPSETERGQLRLFSGGDNLVARFESVLVRFNPKDYSTRVDQTMLRPVPVDPREARRAADVAAHELARSFSVDMREVSPHDWHVLPMEGDLLAEIRTRDYGTLTFSRFGAQPEDVSLMRRDRRLTVSLYRSESQAEAFGRFYSEEDLREYDVTHYDVEARVSPARRVLSGRARLTIRARATMTTLTLRLADPLSVTAVTSDRSGALGFVRLKNQNALFVRLPSVLLPDDTVTLAVTYSGPVESQPLENEEIQSTRQVAGASPPSHLLLSSASLWYPQNPFTDYFTARLQITVPDGYACIASGVPDGRAREDPRSGADRTFVFDATRPLRFLALLAGRFARVDARTLSFDTSPDVGPASLALSVEVSVQQPARERELVGSMESVLRFYSSLMGDVPYPSMALGLVDGDVPGGHSPAYFATMNSPPPLSEIAARNDPAWFQGFPEFYLAHELAHQWWGQAVGWKTYHDQWTSEGFAQYFAALYAQKLRGDRVFLDLLRQFRRWSLSESSYGPVHLGQRLGQVKGGPRVHRALVYNKGAAVLHMLRRIVGDDVFFRGLRRYYRTHRFRSAGTDDLQRAFEEESGRSLQRFFDRWIYGTAIPRIGYSVTRGAGEVTLRLEQEGTAIFDVPITVTFTGEDGESADRLVVMSDRRLEVTLPVSRRVRQVRLNRDSAALAEFVER